MGRKLFFCIFSIIFLLVAIPGTGIFGLFQSESVSANNTFATAPTFPSPTHSPSPSVEPSPEVSSSPSPSVSPSPSPTPVHEPQFPSCPKQPGADIEGKKWDVGYDVGTHWIVTENSLRWGSDYVYYLGEEDKKSKVLQCYYPLPREGVGIQTIWLKKQGDEALTGWGTWGNGADFGLNSGPYLFKNNNFSLE